MSGAKNNPLDDYLDALLAPPEDSIADWDTLLQQAVEPFTDQPDEKKPDSQADIGLQAEITPSAAATFSASTFSSSTLAPGREPVLCVAEQELPLAGRYSYFLNTLMLLKQLPASRLRLCVLQHCDQTLESLSSDHMGQPFPLWINGVVQSERALSHE